MKKVKKKVKKIKKVKKLKNKSRNINWKLINKVELVILAVLFVVGAYRIYTTVPAVREAITLATTIKPETFTELYFENHLTLPANISYNQENKFEFTVHNLEYKTMTYPYEVYIKCTDIGCLGEKQIIDEGKITLKANEYKTIPESFTLTVPTRRIEIVTNLINKNQQIDFWASGIDDSIQQTMSTSTYQPELSSVTTQPQSSTIIVQPKLLTDFYFNYQPPLPITVSSNQIVSFAFTVHNFENQDVIRAYDIYMEENGQITQLDSGQLSLKQDEYGTISQSHAIMVIPGNLARVYVKLTNENRYIYFEVKGI